MTDVISPVSSIRDKSRFCLRRNYGSNFGQKNRDLFCYFSFPGGSSKELPASAGDIRDLVRSLGQEDHLKEGMATPGPSLENPMDRGAWQAAVHRVAKS